jgi:hypothetical protein
MIGAPPIAHTSTWSPAVDSVIELLRESWDR